MKIIFLVSVITVTIAFVIYKNNKTNRANATEIVAGNSLYDFKAQKLLGEEISLSEYKGKVVLIVNVASYCGYTPQYTGLEEIYQKYKDKGFVILGFPCNQFGEQEPGTSQDIKTFCSTNYKVSFQLFEKIEVNGPNSHPLYKYLKSSQTGLSNDDIEWNFTKFLIDKNGKPIKRFSRKIKPEELTSDIEAALK